MNTNETKRLNVTKVYAGGITILLFSAIAGLFVYQDSLTKLTDSVDSERIKNEQMLSQKLILEKEIESMSEEISRISGKNFNLDSRLKNALASIEERDFRIKSMIGENTKSKNSLNELATLRLVKADLQQEIARLTSSFEIATSENSSLRIKIRDLEEENQGLKADIVSLHQVTVNNSMVEATKSKPTRLTVKANKTKRVRVGFDLPEDMVGDLYFQMLTPSGRTVTSNHSKISLVEGNLGEELTASLNGYASASSNKKHVQMVYEPSEKLESGIYRIDVYSGGNYLGTTRIHLK